MHLSFPSRTETSVPTLVALALGLALSAMPASAREHLGPYNNLLLKNPHPDAAGKQYGRGLAAGDFDGDGTSDLVVSEAGGDRLRVLRGLAFAVGSNPLLQFLSTTINMPVHSYTMASGDFDGDGRDEIAVSAMNASAGGQAAAGKVMIINRLGNGTYEVQSTIQAGDTYPGSPQASANLGNSLAAGDFDNDGFTDLAIGIRGQIVGAVANAGAV
ncbi:FG-GAP repeat domain-containing protein, partial [Dokdonella sp.]|uniref:FG-GAP repeat domain-containing protein n=1 Tax=Dokdonella sp. TaxID=2291710 RepID=UPI003C74DBE5